MAITYRGEVCDKKTVPWSKFKVGDKVIHINKYDGVYTVVGFYERNKWVLIDKRYDIDEEYWSTYDAFLTLVHNNKIYLGGE